MNDRWAEFEAELRSADSDRVNDVIDEIGDMDLDDRFAFLAANFEAMTDLYADRDDGYVRQSVVRVADRLVPGLAVVVAVDNDDRPFDASIDEIRARTDDLCGFLLEALTDDDGRVRQSAKRGFRDVVRTYEALEDEQTIEALIGELEAMAEQSSGTQREHLLETRDDAAFHRQSGLGRILERFQAEFEEG